jgi:hypothetical protein
MPSGCPSSPENRFSESGYPYSAGIDPPHADFFRVKSK